MSRRVSCAPCSMVCSIEINGFLSGLFLYTDISFVIGMEISMILIGTVFPSSVVFWRMPGSAVFFDEFVGFFGTPGSREIRRAFRDGVFADVLDGFEDFPRVASFFPAREKRFVVMQAVREQAFVSFGRV